MNVSIRVDASGNIGTGHLMRCLTLAGALRSKGAEVVFVSREHPGHLCELAEEKGFEVIRLEAGLNDEAFQADVPVLAHAAWLGTSQSADAARTITALQGNAPWDWLIVDHYALDFRWETAMRAVADKIMVIDDLADRKHDCDLLLDQNYFQEPEKRYQGLLPEKCETLLGPKFALLRPEFREARKFCRMRGNGTARVLVYFGGNDPNNLTGMALEALCDKSLSHLLVDAVIGPGNPHQDKLEKQTRQRPGTRLQVQPEHFTELMLRADLCIGAGGTTTWERLCLNLPSIVITAVENQKELTRELDKAGYVQWTGANQTDIKNSLTKTAQYQRTSGLPSLVDGLGALRIAEVLWPSDKQDVMLREADLDDMEMFYFWANDPVVRDHSFQTEPILWEDHVNWFIQKTRTADTIIWVMQTSHGLPLGQIRFDKNGTILNISYSLDFIARGRGLGTKLLELGISKASEFDSSKVIKGQVKKDNPASRKIFTKFGFNETTENGISTYTKNIP